MSKKSTIVRFIRGAAWFSGVISTGLSGRLLERLFLTPQRFRKPAREEKWLENANRSSLRFDEKRKLPVFSWGEGPTILLVHGWSGRGGRDGAASWARSWNRWSGGGFAW